MIKTGTSIDANCTGSNMKKLSADFKNKIKIYENEPSETQYWIEAIVEAVFHL